MVSNTPSANEIALQHMQKVLKADIRPSRDLTFDRGERRSPRTSTR
jgi:hypothetical protein